MQAQGFLHKMQAWLEQDQVQYQLNWDVPLHVNALIGQKVRFVVTGKKQCIGCGRSINKTFQQGYCYPCVISKAACDLCIVRPERCHFHLGTCREPEWGEQHCMQRHIVYLANASGLKVGITRKENIPSRFIDQGAVQALPLFEVTSRYHSGLIEVLLAQHLSDKTNWRKMLQGQPERLDLKRHAVEIKALLAPQLESLVRQYAIECTEWTGPVLEFSFPVRRYPAKIVSYSLDRSSLIEDELLGVKGQYCLFEQGVLNLRAFSGYEVQIFNE